jgi:hypothetical protein
MSCKKIEEKFPDFLTGDLDQKSKEKIQAHLASCASCREELESLSSIWTKLGVLSEERPSSGLRARFYTMLESYKQELERKKPAVHFKKFYEGWAAQLWPRRPAFQLSLSLSLLLVGLLVGYLLNAGSRGNGEIAQLREDVHNMQQMVAVSLLDQRSPSERLKGVNWSSRIERPHAGTLEKLIYTLNNDPSVNVRLSVVDALYLFYGNPVVKDGLIHSLSQQTSPLVQVAIIDLIINMHERKAIESLKNLMQTAQFNPEVKQHAESGIENLSF